MALLPDGENFFEDVFIRFDRMYEPDGQTDRHRMTAKAALDAAKIKVARNERREGRILCQTFGPHLLVC